MGKTVLVHFTGFSSRGEAVAEVGGKKLLVWGAIPGESGVVEIRKKRRGELSGELLELTEASPDRILPVEEHYLSCSPWSIMTTEAEVRWKKSLLAQIYREAGLEALTEIPFFDFPGQGYRNKLEFSFTDGPSLSFFQRGSSRRKIAIPGCCLALPHLNEVAGEVVKRLRQSGITAEQLKTLILRGNRAGEVVASLYVLREDFPLLSDLEKIAALKGWRVFFSDPLSPASLRTKLLYQAGDRWLKERILEKEFLLSETGFFQANITAFESALTTMVKEAVTAPLVYDVYAGVGVIGISIGVERTVFVEQERESTELAVENCRLNNLPQPEIINQKAEDFLRFIEKESVVIFDPPRVGLHNKVVEAVLSSRPQKIVYLACNPASQAADLQKLSPVYRLTKFEAYNFFPRTPHLETLAVLERG